MSGLHWRVALATAAFIALAMTAAWAQEPVVQEPCSNACYEQMDKCTDVCANEVENNLCQQESLGEKRSPKGGVSPILTASSMIRGSESPPPFSSRKTNRMAKSFRSSRQFRHS